MRGKHQVPESQAKALAAIILVICLVFTCSACSRKNGAVDVDDKAAITDTGADTGSDSSGTNGDRDDAATGIADAANDHGEASTKEPGVITGGMADDEESAVERTGDNGNTASPESWEGDYSFTEYAPQDQNMFYSIYIYKENESFFAEIYIDGFQTMMRLKARAAENGNRLDLFFDSYLPDNLMDIYEWGDYLLSFEKSGSKLITHWGGIEPMLSESSEASGEYFVKTEYPILLMSFNVSIGMDESLHVVQLTDKTVTYSYYDYSDPSDPVYKEKTVPFSEMLAKEDDGMDKYYMSMFLFDGDNVRELELTEELTERIKSDPEFRKKLGALIGKHFDSQLENDVIDVKNIE